LSGHVLLLIEREMGKTSAAEDCAPGFLHLFGALGPLPSGPRLSCGVLVKE